MMCFRRWLVDQARKALPAQQSVGAKVAAASTSPLRIFRLRVPRIFCMLPNDLFTGHHPNGLLVWSYGKKMRLQCTGVVIW